MDAGVSLLTQDCLDAGAGRKPKSESRTYWRWLIGRILRVRLSKAAISIFGGAVLMALLAPWVSPYNPTSTDFASVLGPPSLAHLMGTDELGRDILSRIIWGARASLAAGLISVSIGLTVGTLLGLVSGYFLGLVDILIMRLIDAILAFPGIILALAITAALGPGLTNAMIAIGIVAIPSFARLTRAQVLAISRIDYVEAARTLGAGHRRILIRHVGPNILTPVIVQASLSMPSAILTEATLSFLGLGVQPPTPSWGFMLNIGRNYMVDAPWMSFFPGLAIFVVVMSINIFGDAIRDAMDPRLRLS